MCPCGKDGGLGRGQAGDQRQTDGPPCGGLWRPQQAAPSVQSFHTRPRGTGSPPRATPHWRPCLCPAWREVLSTRCNTALGTLDPEAVSASVSPMGSASPTRLSPPLPGLQALPLPITASPLPPARSRQSQRGVTSFRGSESSLLPEGPPSVSPHCIVRAPLRQMRAGGASCCGQSSARSQAAPGKQPERAVAVTWAPREGGGRSRSELPGGPLRASGVAVGAGAQLRTPRAQSPHR